MSAHESVWEFKWIRPDQAYMCPRCGTTIGTEKINGNVKCSKYCGFEGRAKEIEEL